MLANSEFASKSLIFADFFIYKSEVHVVSSNFFLFQIQWWLKKRELCSIIFYKFKCFSIEIQFFTRKNLCKPLTFLFEVSNYSRRLFEKV